jgi:branched-chain amino acid transport system substrate-binding protein
MLFKLVATLGAVALIAAACDGDDDDGDGAAAKDCTWVIGTLGALSGDNASLGIPIADGVEFAIDQANEAGDLACDLEYQAEDSEGDPDQAPALAQKLVENQKLVAVAGPYFSGETVETGDIFTQAGVAFSGTGTNETIDQQNFGTWFRAVAPDNIQAEVAAAYIERLGASKVTVIHDNQDYSKGLAEGVLDNLPGVETQGALVINPVESDYSTVVEQVNRFGPDVVYYGGYTPQVGLLLRQLDEAGVEAQFISDDGSKNVTFGEVAGEAAVGAQVTCPCTDPTVQEGASDFVEGMRDAYGEDAPGTFAADMYDVTNIIIEALGDLSGDEPIKEVRQRVVAYFDNADGIQGVAKSYTWEDNGEFQGGPEDIWLYEWDEAEGNFVSLGPASEFID